MQIHEKEKAEDSKVSGLTVDDLPVSQNQADQTKGGRLIRVETLSLSGE